jgi:large subunit ribosomal protein L25
MAEQTELEIKNRELMGKAAKRLRKQGVIPANIFGHHEASQAVQVDAIAFDRLRRSHGARSIISLRSPDSTSPQTVLIRHIQRDPRTQKITHIDFFRVSMSERINVKVPLRFVGEAPAVKNDGGVLLHLLDTLEVECVASDIPEYLEVDVTPLTEIDAIIHASDVKLPPNFTLLTDPEEGVVKVGAPRIEREEEAPAAAAAEAPAAAETPEQPASSEE